jgi:preprotein translocase subunit SecG
MLTTILIYLLTVVEILTSILLVGIILLQKPKSQGAGLAFGAGMGESLFGSQVGNVLTRTTVILAIVFLVNTTLLALLGASRKGQASVTDRMPTPAGAPAARPGAPLTPPPMNATPEEPLAPAEPITGVPSAVEPVAPVVPPAGAEAAPPAVPSSPSAAPETPAGGGASPPGQ